MKKSDLIKSLLMKHGYLSHAEVESIVNIVFDTMCDSLLKGNRIEIRGFGSFSIRKRSARIARNPRTGQKVQVLSKKMPYFRAGKNIGKILNS